MNRSLLLHDTALGVLGIGLGVLADHVHALDDGALLADQHFEDLTLLPLALAGVHDHRVPFLDMQFH